MFPSVDFTLIGCNDNICSRKCPCWAPPGAKVAHVHAAPCIFQKEKKMVWLTSEYRKKLKLLVEVRVTGRGLTPQACLQEIPVKVRETDTLVIITVSWRLGCYGGYVVSRLLSSTWLLFYNSSINKRVKIE